MKKINYIKKTILLFCAIFLFNACVNEYTITTKIFPDGYRKRIITIKGDSSAIYNSEYPIMKDNGWETSLELVDEKDEKYLYTAKKHFNSIKELQEEFYIENNRDIKVNSDIKLKKQFRWFYTYLTYTEIFKTLCPFNSIPAKENFSEKEIILLKSPPDDENLLTREDSLKSDEFEDLVDNKLEKWLLRNTFEEIFRIVLNGAEKSDDPDFTPGLLLEKKNQMIHLIENYDDPQSEEEKRIMKLIDGNEQTDYNTWIKALEGFMNTKSIWMVVESERSDLEEFTRQYKIIEGYSIFNEYTNIIQIPGLILSTNTKTIEGNTLTWKYGLLQFLLMDYEMEVESRIINIWAFILSGLFILVIIAGITVGALRRRR